MWEDSGENQSEKAVVNRWVLSLDLKSGSESVVCSEVGREFQREGAERLKALLPIVVRRTRGTVRRMLEEDLRVRE